MRFWWVNHKKTFRQEFYGDYIWCPKKKITGAINHFYETVREVAPGDIILSYADAKIQGYGVAKTICYSCPQPDDFGNIGKSWDIRGWRVDINFMSFSQPISTIENANSFSPLLPQKYSPIRKNGYGNQGAYLSEVSLKLIKLVARLNSIRIPELTQCVSENSEQLYTTTSDQQPVSIQGWEDIQQREIELSAELQSTTREALVLARRGQGLFKQRVSTFEKFCRITNVDNMTYLIASHIKPWRESNNDERLSAGNGLLLTPSIDHLFDRGIITFSDDGELIVSPIADTVSLNRMGVFTEQTVTVGDFNSDQKHFLNYHREEIFLKAGC